MHYIVEIRHQREEEEEEEGLTRRNTFAAEPEVNRNVMAESCLGSVVMAENGF